MLYMGILVGIGFIFLGIIVGISLILQEKNVPASISIVFSLFSLIITLQVLISIVSSDSSADTGLKASLYRKIQFIVSSFPLGVDLICSAIAEVLDKISVTQPTTKIQYRSVINKRAVIVNNTQKSMQSFRLA